MKKCYLVADFSCTRDLSNMKRKYGYKTLSKCCTNRVGVSYITLDQG